MADGVQVRGELMKWAREQQGYSRREVRARGGPGESVQREVEDLGRTTVREHHLPQWASALNVTLEFARGAVPTYCLNPTACYGLASDVAPLIPADFVTLDPSDRVREMLRLIATRSLQLPLVVLAHVLDFHVFGLQHLLNGHSSITVGLLGAVSQLTTLPQTLFIQSAVLPMHGTATLKQYLRSMRVALTADISPEQVEQLLIGHALGEYFPRWGFVGA